MTGRNCTHKKGKKLTALLLTMVMALGLTGTALTAKTEYTDIPDWAKEYVGAVTEAGLIDGKTATTFAPDENMTRADLAEALYRLAGKPAASGENLFTDVAGDHANDDMADPDDEASWYSVFSAAGLKVVDCQINGLGEIEELRQLLVEHARNARPLDDTGITSQPNLENPDNEELEKGAEEPAKTETLADGVSTVEVECEQSMFKIDNCQLTVKYGKMTAALDQALDYAAHSKKNNTWYDRTLTFVSDTAVAK